MCSSTASPLLIIHRLGRGQELVVLRNFSKENQAVGRCLCINSVLYFIDCGVVGDDVLWFVFLCMCPLLTVYMQEEVVPQTFLGMYEGAHTCVDVVDT